MEFIQGKENLSVQEFLDSLEESKLLSAEEMERASNAASTSAVDGASFAQSLVATGVLTSYQMETVCSRNFTELRIGNYEVLDRLGAGGMGTVFKARHRRMKRIVALKLLSSNLAKDDKFLRRFQREIEAIARLSHPNIVMAYDADEDTAGPFLVMECVDGDDLAAQVQKHGPLDVPTAVNCVLQAARGLEYAHRHGIIHRDIKPANLLRDSMGMVKVSDLGVARLNIVESAAELSGITQAGGIVGSVHYMSPEQATDSTSIDYRADIYSLGATLYFLLHGRPPYQAQTMMAVFLKHREAPIPSLAEARTDVPAALDAVFRRMVAKVPGDRYQTMTEVVRALETIEATNAGKTGVTLIHEVEKSATGPLPSADHYAETRVESAVAMDGEKIPITASPSAERARQAERRQVTVLICGCDLFESEAFLDDVDAEDQAHVLRLFQETCAPAIRRFDGTVVRFSTRGLIVCFGYPTAYEDAASRAAEAGLSILEDMKAFGNQISRDYNLELNASVGIHTGQAVVEAREGTVSLVGDARNVAVRLEEFARSEQVVCSEATYRLIAGHFESASLGLHKIKGAARPVEIFHLQSVMQDRSPIDTAERVGLTPLTGRDHEISLLKDRWEQAQEGMGQVVLIIGEPGLGKSRLMHTLKEHVLGQMVEGDVDAPVIEWRCSPHFQNTSLYPAVDFYERALAFDRQEPPEARFDRLLHRLEQYDLVRPETIPLWASLLSLPTPERFPPLSLSPVRQREETFRFMLEWLHTRASRKPVLFVVEDLHWVDASTLEFLGQFLAEGLHDSILTLLTFRPEFKTPWPALAHQTSLSLNRLTRRQVSELISSKTRGQFPESLVEQIYDRTGGVPLFVEEFTKMVQEASGEDQGRIGDKWAKTSLAREIPITLQDLVMARLGRLEGDRELAQLAAVLGREFDYEVLSAVTTMNEPALQAELAKLVQAEILYQKGRLPRCKYIFKHALLEDALYNALVKDKRQQFHQRIGEALEAQFPQTAETQPELLAYHFTEAGLTEKAIGYWLKAGLRSRERSAEVEAIGHLTRGLALIETLEASPERDARELELLRPLGSAYMASHGYAAPEVGPVFARSRELCDRVGQPPQVFASMYGNWAFHFVRGDLWRSTDLASEALEFARQHGDPEIIMEALKMRGQTMLYRADFPHAHEKLAMALDKYDDRERTKKWEAYTSQDPAVANRCHLSVSMWHLGFPDQALKINREMRRLAREIGHPFTLAYALHHVCWLNLGCQLGAELTSASKEQTAISSEQGFPLWEASGIFFKGAGLLQQGHLQDGLPLILKGLNTFQATGAELMLTYQFSTLGQAYTQAGQFEEARQALDDGLALVQKNDERCQESELHRLKGELLLAESTDQAAAAEDCFRQAIKVAQRQQSRAWELRSTVSLARLWQQQRRIDEAREALAAIYGTYTEGFTTPDLVEAKALLLG